MFEEGVKVERTPIYSKWTVLGFCVLFSPIFGGFLLRQNLVDKGEAKMGNLFLLVSLLFTLITFFIGTTALRGPGTTFMANFLEGALLVEFVFRKHFLDEDSYPKKSLRKPLIISLMVVSIMMLLIILSGVPLIPQ
jgi:4-amino-4-deoxy-L-arabinose transferase-like glycosyltransferase